ncbi:MAG: hypothetical protein D6706_17675 [Chloroflexi bacterium]|nr:MAG: hypothetical protein D6706_17675 [Chloroflexota bacterium]
MAVFASAEQMYACFQEVFACVEESRPDAADAVLASGLVIRFRCTEPVAELTIDGGKRPLQIHYGPAKTRPTLEVALTADTLHQIMSGHLSLTKALGRGLLKPKGPVWKVKTLAPLFDEARRHYTAVVRKHGIKIP